MENKQIKENSDPLLREKEAADVLGVSIRCLQDWRFRGRGPRFIRLTARMIRYRASEIAEFLSGREFENTSQYPSQNKCDNVKTVTNDSINVYLYKYNNDWYCGTSKNPHEGDCVLAINPKLAHTLFVNKYTQYINNPIQKRICSICGCTDDKTCKDHPSNIPCQWAEGEWDLCSSCASKPLATISDWQREIHALAKAKGWWNHTRSTGDLCSLMHSEVSELFKAHRNGTLDQPCDKIPELTNFEEEAADIFIRLLDWCEFKNVDLISCVRMKHEYNRNRAYRHGGKQA